jgi:hypothetical protein
VLIKKISNSDSLEYNDLAKKHGTIFNTIDWLKIFGDKAQVFGIYDKGDNLIGGFTIYEERKFGLHVFRDSPFTPTIGPFLKIDAKNPVAVMGIWKEALSSMAEFIESLPYSIASFSLDKNIVDTQPFIWKKFKITPRYTYLRDLSKTIDDIWAEMSAERRNDLNKAIRDGLIVKQVKNFEIVKSLVLKTFLRQNLTVKRYYLDKILFEFASDVNSFAFTTYREDNPIAVSFCVCDKETAYYLLGGYDYEKKHHGAGALATWEAIKYAQQLGLKYFDFEGSMVPQIERYFRGFGGQLTPYYRVNKAKLPLEILLKFFRRDLF